MSAPLLVLLATGLLSIVVFWLRNRPQITFVVAGLGAALVGSFSLWGSIDEPVSLMGSTLKLSAAWNLLGRALVLDSSNRAQVGFLYFVASFVFGGGYVARAGRHLYSIGLATLAVVAGSLMIRPFVFAPLFLEFSALGAALLLASPSTRKQRGSLRLLVLYTLSMMVILVAGWLLEVGGVTSTTPVTLLLGIGFGILMVVPPFHLWLPAAAEEAHPYALAFVGVVLQSAGVFFMLRFLDTYEWLRVDSTLFLRLRWLAVTIILFGAAWTLAQESFSRTLAYALLTDFGVMLLAVSVGNPAGFRLALGLTGVRAVGLTVWAIGASVLQAGQGGDTARSLLGAGHRSPYAAAAALTGMFSLTGIPLTAGFPGKWSLLSVLASSSLQSGFAVIVAMAALGAASMRWMSVFLSGEADSESITSSPLETFFLLGGVGIILLLGTFPQVLLPWMVQALDGLSNLGP